MTMQKKLRIIILSILCCLAGKSLADGETLINYVLVTDASTLAEGDKLIIVNTSEGMAMANKQPNNYRTEGVTITNNSIVLSSTSPVEIITLEGKTDAWYLKTESGYLCAASNSANQLKTKEDKDNNAKAKITITNNNATIKFQGSYTRNTIKYNSSGYFSCYSSDQQPVQLRFGGGDLYEPAPASVLYSQTHNGYVLSGFGFEETLSEIYFPTAGKIAQGGIWEKKIVFFT